MDTVHENIKELDIGAKKVKNNLQIDLQEYINLCNTTSSLLDSIEYSKEDQGDLHEVVKRYLEYFILQTRL